MKRRDLEKALKQAGWLISQGENHNLATHPQRPGVKIPISRQREIPAYTAGRILQDAGLK